MRLHQALSFSSLMMHVPQSEAVFWPGCALLNLDGEILEKTLAVLRRAEPSIELCTCCCGQPTVYLFPEREEERQKKLAAQLRAKGVRRIYTGCPNCTVQLKGLEDLEVFSVWPILSEQIRAEDLLPGREAYVWHDPCPTRTDAEQQAAVRRLLQLSGCDYTEPPHSGCTTVCCGNFHMLHTLRPEIAVEMRKRRLAELPEDRIILSSCEGCLGAFRSAGRAGMHLLELLFGKSSARGWGNRFKTTFRQK